MLFFILLIHVFLHVIPAQNFCSHFIENSPLSDKKFIQKYFNFLKLASTPNNFTTDKLIKIQQIHHDQIIISKLVYCKFTCDHEHEFCSECSIRDEPWNAEKVRNAGVASSMGGGLLSVSDSEHQAEDGSSELKKSSKLQDSLDYYQKGFNYFYA